jgi:3-(3-hydroxy-phenyl)propionate hydroxylase
VYDVAIVGAGPTGVVAAKLCGVYGLSAVAFDREAEVYDLPRAVGMWDDVQRILQNAGVLDAVLPATCIHVGAEFVTPDGTRLTGLEIPEGFTTASGHPALRGFHQPMLERAIRACLAAHDDVRLALAHEVAAITPHPDHVALTVRDRADGATTTIEARWLIGCDGASSFVRKTCGIAWNSLGYDREWLVVDVRLQGETRLSPLAQQVCDPARPVTLVPGPLRLHRWEFQLLPGETREEMERPARVWELLRPWIAPSDAELLRAVVYRFHATIAETFRHGRVFLAGDAAHQTPPFMGQGLCSGVRDVDNLVWKLDLVTRGLADDALLDTYTAERHPIAVGMVEHSVNTGRLIDAYSAMVAGGPEPSPELQAYGYGGSAELPHVTTGLLAPGDSPWLGKHVPQCPVVTAGGAGMLDDVVGPRWAIVSAGDPRAVMSAATQRYWERLGAVFVRVPEPAGPMLGLLLAHQTVIARPDRIIYAVHSGDAPFDVHPSGGPAGTP